MSSARPHTVVNEQRYFQGNIDEVAIYRRALTPVEVSDLFLRVK